MNRFLPACYLLAIALCTATVRPAFAQRYHTRTFTEADGLPSHVINGIAQDARGYLWCVTPAGIVTFDGTEWAVQPPAGSAPPETWKHLAPAPDGSMWVVSRAVPVRAARWKSGSWRDFPPPAGPPTPKLVTDALSVRRGERLALVVATRPGVVYIWNNTTWGEARVPAPMTTLAAIDDTVYAAGGDGVYRMGDHSTQFTRMATPGLPSGRIMAINASWDGGLWVIGASWIARLTPGGHVLRIASRLHLQFEPTAEDLVAQDDGTGGLYVGNVPALYHFDRNGSLVRFGRHSGMVTPGTTALTRDTGGHIWVASLRGVTMIEGLSFVTWTEAHGLLEDEVSLIAPLDAGRLLLGHVDGVSVLARNRSVERTIRIARSQYSVRILDYETDTPGSLWLAANTAGLLRYHDGKLDPSFRSLTGNSAVTSVRRDGRGQLWILTTASVIPTGGGPDAARFDFKSVYPNGGGFFRRLIRASDGSLLVASNRGVMHVDHDSLRVLARSASPRLASVFAILDEPDRPLLLGTNGGLCHIEDGRIVPVDHPYIRRPVYFLTPAPDGTLWIGTSNGVVHWNGVTAREINVEDGLAGRETNRAASLIDTDGTVWIGTASGVTRYDAHLDFEHAARPRVELTGLEIDGEARPYNEPVSLKYDRNNVSFQFRAISFADPRKIRYRNRLEGFDNDWVGPYVSPSGGARYVNLPPGKYRFLVQAANDGAWGPIVASPVLSVLQAWWKRPAFVFVWIACVALLIAAIVRFLAQRRYARSLQIEVDRRTGELQRAERELARHERLDALGLLAGGIAHDFNNLLTVILGNLGLLAEDRRLDTFAREGLSDAIGASKRAKALASQLLTFSRGGAPVRETASIAEAIRESIAFVLRGSTVRATVHVPDSLWLVDIDTDQINQVLNNLLINAAQAMPDGGEIEVTANNVEGTPHRLPRGRYVRIRVRDQGRGIPVENRERIFDPYFTTREGGTGLGLATAHSIIKRHEGLLTMEATAGRGSTFDIYLPASSATSVPEEPIVSSPETLHANVLVMDDEPAVRGVYGAMLQRVGCHAEFAKNGEDAVDRYEAARRAGASFDVVILDLTVPGAMGGRAALDRLRQIDPHVRAIVSSGYSGDPVLADPAAHGFAARITKPFHPKDLSSALVQALGNSPTDHGSWRVGSAP